MQKHYKKRKQMFLEIKVYFAYDIGGFDSALFILKPSISFWGLGGGGGKKTFHGYSQ